jgi:hypothetical protein
MVLDGSGSPLISSNTQPKLWRIDADTFEVQERAIRLLDREEWDVGFGSLLLTRNGNLMALSATGGWLWSIDLVSGDASLWNWGSPMLNACDLAPVE